MYEQNNGGALYNLGRIRVETEDSEFRGNSAVSEKVLSFFPLTLSREILPATTLPVVFTLHCCGPKYSVASQMILTPE